MSDGYCARSEAIQKPLARTSHAGSSLPDRARLPEALYPCCRLSKAVQKRVVVLHRATWTFIRQFEIATRM